MSHPAAAPTRFKPYSRQTIALAPAWQWMSPEQQEAIQVVSHVLPFRTNDYVLEQLIDWRDSLDDPIYRLTFPHRDMLPAAEYERLRDLVLYKKDEAATARQVAAIRHRMRPQHTPRVNEAPLNGLQHKYRETVAFFPSAAQTCHAYCTFCFRWPQFVGMEEMRFDPRECGELVAYLAAHPEVTDVLLTGGDPMVMPTRTLASYIEPLLAPELAHLQNIRIGTKAVAYWPQRFVTDRDAGDLLRLFEKVARAGKNIAIMGHYSHAAELRTDIAQQAVRRIVGAGANLRMQGPLIRHVNEDPKSWAELWTTGVRLGAIPYYMFVERDTGPRDYFALPLAKAHAIFQSAYQMVSGLSRTVRGPSMSAFPGKVVIDGVVTINGEKLFALQFLQSRNPDWIRKPFFARYDPHATWLDELAPAFGRKKFFFEQDPGDAGYEPPERGVIPIADARHLRQADGVQPGVA